MAGVAFVDLGADLSPTLVGHRRGVATVKPLEDFGFDGNSGLPANQFSRCPSFGPSRDILGGLAGVGNLSPGFGRRRRGNETA